MTSMGKRGSQRLPQSTAIAATCPSVDERSALPLQLEELLTCADSLP
jgi:hypothetical protein